MNAYERIVLAVSLIAAALALAVPTALAAPLENPWATLDVTLHPEGEAGGPVLLVSAELDDAVKLPAEVSLSVPKGAEVLWVGEVMGGDIADDVEASHTVEPADGYDRVVFTLTKARRGQVELSVPSAVTGDASQRTATLDWTSDANAAVFHGVMRMLPGAQVQKMSMEASPTVAQDGSTYYVLPPGPIKAGDRVTFSITYVPSTTQNANELASTTSSGPSPFIFVGLALVVLAFLFVLSRRRPTEDDEDDGEDNQDAPVEEPSADDETTED